MAHFYINERADMDLTILDLAGPLRRDRANILLGDTFKRLVRRGQNQIILNFLRVSCLDGFGVQELIKGFNMISNAGGQLKLCSVNSRSLELMPLTELSTVFDLFACEKDAADSFLIRRNRFRTKAGTENEVPDLDTMFINTKMVAFFTQMIRRDGRPVAQ